MSITPAAVVLKANKSPDSEVSTNILDCESLEGEAGERGALFRPIKEIQTFFALEIFGRSGCKELASGHIMAKLVIRLIGL